MRKKASLVGGALIFLSLSCSSLNVHVDPADIDYQPGTEEKLVLAHYMIWFETPEMSNRWRHWSWDKKPHKRNPDRIFPNGRRDIVGIHYPLIGPYDSASEDVLEYHVLLAKAAGIDGFIVNWYGFKDAYNHPRYEDQNFRKLLKIAERLDFKVAINFEEKSMFSPFKRNLSRDQSMVLAQQTMRKICVEYGRSPACLKLNGRPVLAQFGWKPPLEQDPQPGSFTPGEWRKILRSTARCRPVFIANHHWHWERTIFQTGFLKVADSLYPWVTDNAKLRQRFYQQAQQAKTKGQIEFVSGGVYPGFDSCGSRGWGNDRVVISRKGGGVYKTTWKECLQNNVKLIQIITWNDFAEGTTIEPTLDYEYRYLEMTADFTAILRGKKPDYAALRIPKKIYDLRRARARLEAETGTGERFLDVCTQNADRAVRFMAREEYAKANTLADHMLKRMMKAEAEIKAPGKIEISLHPPTAKLRAGDTKYFWVEVKNNLTRTIRGKIKLDSDRKIPRDWFNRSTLSIELTRGQHTRLPFRIAVPEEAVNQQAKLEAHCYAGGKFVRSRLSIVDITTPYLHVDLGPRHILRLGQASDVRVSITGLKEDSGRVSLALPPGWESEPAMVNYVVKDGQVPDIRFKVIPAATQAGEITAYIESRSRGKVEASEPFRVVRKKEVVLLAGDINDDGSNDYVLGNWNVEAHFSPVLGGRILSFYLQSTGNDQLYGDFLAIRGRAASASQEWVEYGGINDTFPHNWPGEVWNTVWQSQPCQEAGGAESLIQTVETKKQLRLVRKATLKPGASELVLRYTVTNRGKEIARYRWHNHPDLAPGPAATAEGKLYLIVPTEEKLVKKLFVGGRTKEHFTPAQNWVLALDSESGEYLLQKFSLKHIAKIGVWQGWDFFTMELMSREATLKPGKSKSFTVTYVIGKDDWKKYVR